MPFLYNTPLIISADDRTAGFRNDDGATRYLKVERSVATVALADAAATLTAAQLLDSSMFTITPTVARTLTTDTAAAIIAALPVDAQIGHTRDCSILVLAAFAVTLAAGTGVTLVGAVAATSATMSWLIRVDSATTVTMYRVA